jgi:hypothetical protein
MIVDNDNDVNSPRGLSLQVQKEGTDLHNSIDQYINSRTIDEDSVLFSTWLKTFANTTFLASEQLLYHKEMLYGGTADAFYFDPEDKSGTFSGLVTTFTVCSDKPQVKK